MRREVRSNGCQEQRVRERKHAAAFCTTLDSLLSANIVVLRVTQPIRFLPQAQQQAVRTDVSVVA